MTGCIILSCGHEDELVPHGIPIIEKDWECGFDGFQPVLFYSSICRDCMASRITDDEWVSSMFFNEYEAEQWVKQESKKTRETRKQQDLEEAEQLEQRAKELRSKYE